MIHSRTLYIVRGGHAEKWTFDWVIAPSNYGCVVVEWILGFSKKYLKFHFGQSPQVVLGLVKIWGHRGSMTHSAGYIVHH